MKGLVTGAAGGLGGAVAAALLARGDAVRAFVRRPDPQLAAAGAEVVVGDVRRAADVAAACRGVDVVFHTAGVAGIAGPWRRYFEANTLGTRHVLNACRAAGVGRLVFTSSPSVTFDGGDQRGVDESVPYAARWLCHYPHSKALAEQEVLAASGRDGLLTCALRPHLLWGPGDRQLVPRVIDAARRGRLRRVGDGTNLVDITYLDNAALAHLQAADALRPGSPVCGRAYFVSQGEPVNGWDWIDELLALAGLPPLRRSISFRSAWTLGAVLETAYGLLRLPGEPPMTRFLAAEFARHHYFDIGRARRDFGYEPRVSTAEGMRRLGEGLRGLGS